MTVPTTRPSRDPVGGVTAPWGEATKMRSRDKSSPSTLTEEAPRGDSGPAFVATASIDGDDTSFGSFVGESNNIPLYDGSPPGGAITRDAIGFMN